MIRKKRRMALLLAVLLLAVGVGAEAATIDAANCSRSSVQSAVNAAKNGDVVRIPNGKCTWSDPVTITNKTITLRGNGVFAVDVNHADQGTWPLTITLTGNTGVSISGRPGDVIRVSGIHFTGPSEGYWGPGGDSGMITLRDTNRSNSWRIDNCKFSPAGLSSAAMHIKYGYGVIDHCYFTTSDCDGIFVRVSRYGPSGVGAESFTDPVDFGTSNFVFFENNVFRRTCSIPNSSPEAIDTQGGGRWVARYCYFHDSFLFTHGSESGDPERGGYAIEIYNNTFYWHLPADRYHTAFYLRGGTTLVHNNIFTNFGTMCRTWVRRTGEPTRTFGLCDGTQPWDGNTSPAGYPCLDQVGRGRASGSSLSTVQPQESYPARFWSNVLNNVQSPLWHNNPSYTVEGRDFFYSADASAKLPGYTPYTYPHPLTTGGNPVAIRPPQNIHIEKVAD